MVHQTDKDIRLQVAELALNKLRSGIFSKSTVRPGISKDAANDLLNTIESQLMAAKYSYMEPRGLADSAMIGDIHEHARELYMGYRDALKSGMDPLPRSNVLWAFNILGGLSRRLLNPGEKTTHGIDVFAVKIRNINKRGQLWHTRSSAGEQEYTIITNIEGLEAGDTLLAALLPPAVVGGAVSEAMFLGPERHDMEAGRLVDPADLETKEADSILYNELQGL